MYGVFEEGWSIAFDGMSQELNAPACKKEISCNSQIKETIDERDADHRDSEEMSQAIEWVLVTLFVFFNTIHHRYSLCFAYSLQSSGQGKRKDWIALGSPVLVFLKAFSIRKSRVKKHELVGYHTSLRQKV